MRIAGWVRDLGRRRAAAAPPLTCAARPSTRFQTARHDRTDRPAGRRPHRGDVELRPIDAAPVRQSGAVPASSARGVSDGGAGSRALGKPLGGARAPGSARTVGCVGQPPRVSQEPTGPDCGHGSPRTQSPYRQAPRPAPPRSISHHAPCAARARGRLACQPERSGAHWFGAGGCPALGMWNRRERTRDESDDQRPSP